MSDSSSKIAEVVLLCEGVELLGSVGDDETRVVIFKDNRDGVYYWYELQFFGRGDWDTVFRIGSNKMREAIDLLSQALEKVSAEEEPVKQK